MFLLKKTLSALLLPPTGPLLAAMIGLLLIRFRPRFGRFLVAAGAGSLLLMSLPLVSQQLMAPLEDMPPASSEALTNAQAIVIAGGGSYRNAPEFGGLDTVSSSGLERIRYGAVLARHTGLPVAVVGGVVVGGQPEAESMRTALIQDFGVTPQWLETQSRDTEENARFLAPILKAAGIQRIALVTHAWHMKRARGHFERQGFEVIAAPTAYYTAATDATWLDRLPSASALHASADALHEWLGLLAARLFETDL